MNGVRVVVMSGGPFDGVKREIRASFFPPLVRLIVWAEPASKGSRVESIETYVPGPFGDDGLRRYVHHSSERLPTPPAVDVVTP